MRFFQITPPVCQLQGAHDNRPQVFDGQGVRQLSNVRLFEENSPVQAGQNTLLEHIVRVRLLVLLVLLCRRICHGGAACGSSTCTFGCNGVVSGFRIVRIAVRRQRRLLENFKKPVAVWKNVHGNIQHALAPQFLKLELGGDLEVVPMVSAARVLDEGLLAPRLQQRDIVLISPPNQPFRHFGLYLWWVTDAWTLEMAEKLLELFLVLPWERHATAGGFAHASRKHLVEHRRLGHKHV
mmetsp:Transcript_10246/g.30419  ORF Transcript_10246/g.30419 Transcript_10246/m.30419 type:complete len:238 (-) Transcript_10246:135-848(-)